MLTLALVLPFLCYGCAARITLLVMGEMLSIAARRAYRLARPIWGSRS